MSMPASKRDIAKLKRRLFDAAKTHDFLTGWVLEQFSTFHDDMKKDLAALRSRSRDVCANDPYAKRYLQLLKTYVVGPNGIQLRAKSKNAKGKLDKAANTRLESAYKEWCKHCTVDGLSLVEAQKLFITTLGRDGEVLVQFLRGKTFGKFGFLLRFLEIEHLDINYNDVNNGNPIRSGVQYDEYGRVMGYWVWKYHPSDTLMKSSQKRMFVKATDMIHAFQADNVGQGRGVPHFAAAMIDLKQIKDYTETELVASRVAAAKMGFFTSEGSEDFEGEDDEVMTTQEAKPGTFDYLPPGVDLKTFDPQNPNANYPNFTKAVLKGIASSVGVSYYSLTGDLDSASYSAARSAALDERETFQDLQNFVVERFCQPVYEQWLESTLLNNVIGFPMERYEKFADIEWRKRSYSFIDPSKETQAIKMQLDYKLKSRTEIVKSMGRDIDDVMDEISEEQQGAESKGVMLAIEKAPTQKDVESEEENA